MKVFHVFHPRVFFPCDRPRGVDVGDGFGIHRFAACSHLLHLLCFLRDQSDPREKLGVNIKRIIGQNHELLPLGLHRNPDAR